MADRFKGRPDHVADPARQVFAIAPHDINELAILPKALRANTAGTITFRAVGSTVDVLFNVVAGEVLDVRARYVRALGTTGTFHGLA